MVVVTQIVTTGWHSLCPSPREVEAKPSYHGLLYSIDYSRSPQPLGRVTLDGLPTVGRVTIRHVATRQHYSGAITPVDKDLRAVSPPCGSNTPRVSCLLYHGDSLTSCGTLVLNAMVPGGKLAVLRSGNLIASGHLCCFC